jgi:hypothetical protein
VFDQAENRMHTIKAALCQHWGINSMRVVIAHGGNVLLQRGQAMSAENQRINIRPAA